MYKYLLIALCAALGANGIALAEPVQLRLASPSAPQGMINQGVVIPWAEEVSKASDGTLEIKVFAGPALANYGNVYDRTIQGVVEAAFGIFGPITSDFPRASVVALPFETKTGEEAALAMWRLYAKGVIASEFQKIHLLAVNVFPNVSLHFRNKHVKTLADMNGLKLTGEGRVIGRSITALGAAPVTIPVTELYNATQRAVVDGSAIAWPAILTYKLDETTKFHLDIPLANDSAMTFMNKDAYAKLPAKAKAAIDARSGEPLVRRFTTTVDGMTNGAREQAKKQPDQVIYTLDPAEEARWIERVKPSIEEWVRTTPDGARVLAAYRDEVKKIRAGM
jgi:TRAP-type C4-dicarboxylate transport system substrate-binding protein